MGSFWISSSKTFLAFSIADLKFRDFKFNLNRFLYGSIKETSKLFRWFNCLAYATLAALIARTIIFPAGVLVDSTYSSRLIVVLLSLFVFFISKKNYIYPTIFSAICMAIINNYI